MSSLQLEFLIIFKANCKATVGGNKEERNDQLKACTA